MSSKVIITFALTLAATVSHAGACDKGQPEYRNSVRLVDSLRPDKAGQMRVFAADGSEFNAGQVQWMKARLREVDSLCARGTEADEARAARILQDVRELLDSHKRRT
jgi:hypothetical protein